MVGHRWGRTLAPGILAIGTTAALVASTVAARDRPWTPAACAGDGAGRVADARIAAPRDPAAIAGEPWFRADPRLDGDGALAGQRLVVGRRGRGRAGDARPATGGVRGRAVRRPGPRRRGRRRRLQAVGARCRRRLPRAARHDRGRHPTGDRQPGRVHHLRGARGAAGPRRPRDLVAPARRDVARPARPPGAGPRRALRTHVVDGARLVASRATGSSSSRAARCRAGRGCSTRRTAPASWSMTRRLDRWSASPVAA